MKKKLFFTLTIILALSFVFSAYSQQYRVEDFGATANSKKVSTRAIQKAIDQCFANGGGTVVLSGGRYLSGTLQLKSNVSLQISPGSVLKATEDPDAFKKVQSDVISRMDVVPWKAFLHAENEENIRIFGGGTIDGSGDAPCFQDGIENSPERPYGLFFVSCRNVRLENLMLQSSAFWMQRYFNCSGIRLSDLKIFNHANKNNDGIDIDSSDDVIISNCTIDSSDDAIVIKSEGEKTSKNIVVNNCIIGTHASAIKLGTGSVGGYENITISNIVIRRSESKVMKHPHKVWQGLTGIDLITTDGGVLRNVMVSNVVMEGVQNPIHVRLGNRLSGSVARQGYGGNGDDIQGVKMNEKSAEITEQFILEDVLISGILCKNVGPYPVIIAGFKDNPVKRVSLRDITLICGIPGTQNDLDTEPNWNPGGYPGRGMYGTHLPAYGLVSYWTQDLVVENFRAIPAEGEVRPVEMHYFRVK